MRKDVLTDASEERSLRDVRRIGRSREEISGESLGRGEMRWHLSARGRRQSPVGLWELKPEIRAQSEAVADVDARL
ncbi:hypothetical protein EYF80_024235 [Liparis tanakae]|uniref:Uncharacterized protein n=1 Tax=Liparis tanakae TaxID=230148 RepID=A0A4Z2HIE8_9TELE|nr:hypothetical protein EYF80_024235 [Liparis tanakae]